MFAAPLMVVATLAMQLPPDTLRYHVVNHGGHAGTMDVVTVADTIVVRVRSQDRGNETDATTRYVTDDGGTIIGLEASTAARHDPFERFALADGMARWRTQVDSRTAAVDAPRSTGPGATTHSTPHGSPRSCSTSRSRRPTFCLFARPPALTWQSIRW